MLWLQRRRLTIARRSKNSRMVFSTTFLSASLVGMLLISWMNVIRNGNFPSDSSNNDNLHLFIVPQVQQSTSVINIPATTIPHSIDKVKHQNSTLIDSLKRDNLGLQQRSNPRLPETTDYLIQLSLEHDAKNLADQLRNHALVYFPGPWDGSGIVIEEFKLVFFTQGKVACTVFKQLFRRMMNIENWMVDNAKLPHNPRENGLTYLYHYNVADALTILTHPDWTRAIFVRDPKERTLSAFLDKASRKKGKYVQRHCCNQMESKCGEEANASFMGFLRVIKENCCCDPHWRPQSIRIDSAFRPFINFVGHFERIQQDTKSLLNRLNSNHNKIDNDTDNEKYDLWTTYGASGWGRLSNESIFARDTKARHQTSAITKLKQYYNASVEVFVENLFVNDYDDPLLNFTSFLLFNDNETTQRLFKKIEDQG